jgi:amino acid adenylation domain-containing protein
MLVGYRPSPQQLRLFRLAEVVGGKTSSARCWVRLRGAVNPGRLAAALGRVVARQAVLRTRLERLPGMSLPMQVEDPASGGPIPLVRIDLVSLSATARDAALAALWPLPRPAAAPFAARLLALSATEAVLDLDLLPWAADEATLDLLAREIAAAWAAIGAAGAVKTAAIGEGAAKVAPAGEDGEEPFRYAQYAAWRNGLADDEYAAEGRAFWEGLHLRDTEQLALPADLEDTEPGAFSPRRAARSLPASMARRLRETADAIGVPLEIFLLAAWHALLFRWTGRSEGLTGRLVSGREHELLARVLGPLAEALPVRVSLAPDLPFAELARRLAAWCDETSGWQEHFYLGDAFAPEAPGEEPAGFSTLFAWRDEVPAASSAIPAVDGLAFAVERRQACPERSDLLLQVAGAGSGLALDLAYDSGRRQRAAADRLLAQVETLAASAADAPETPLARLALLPPAELAALTTALSGPEGEPPERLRPLHRLLQEQAARTPDRIAVAWRDEHLTYVALDARANRLARHLRAAGLGPEGVVGLLLGRSLDLIVALWAVLKAGGACLPLDPLHPPARLLAMVEAAGARLVVSRGALAEIREIGAPGAPGALTERGELGALAEVDEPGVLAAQLMVSHGALPGNGDLGEPGAAAKPPWRIVDLDSAAAAIARQPGSPLAECTTPEGLAYVIFTSGTTGRPKGVMVEHRSVANLLGALRRTIYDHFASSGRPLVVGLNAPLVFDAAVKQWIQLLSGHTLRLVPEEVRPDGEAFAALVRATGIDAIDCTPSQLGGLLAAGFAAAGEGGPRIVLVGGEAIDAATWRRVAELEALGPARFFNVYGPTECTVDATARPIGASSEAVGAAAAPMLPTLGRPLPGVHAAIVDAGLEPLPHGAAGELLIGGAGVARGYLGQPALTALRFVPDPFSGAAGARLYRTGDLVRLTAAGEIEFLGRRDHQVKVRGFRIELEEVEAALLAEPAVRQAAVRRFEDQSGARLVAYVAPRDPAGAGNATTTAAGSGSSAVIGVGVEVGAGAGTSTETGGTAARTGTAADPSTATGPRPGPAADPGTASSTRPGPAPETTEGDLRAALRRRLPEFMVPAQIVILRDLPLTASGKLDRAALPPPESVRPARAPFVAPASAAERTVAAVWAEVLGVEQVGRDDNFFDLGGHSLLMVRAHGRLQEAFGRPVSMVEMFRLPTVAALAAHLAQAAAGAATAATTPAPAALTAAQERGARQREEQERQRQAMARAAAARAREVR